MRRRANTAEAPGQDSFLDIVANLVGILIILVMVVGARAKDAIIDAAPVEEVVEAPPEEEEIDVKTPMKASRSMETNINDLDERLQRQKFEVAYRQQERDSVLSIIKAIEYRIAEHAKGLEDADREAYEVRSQLAISQNAFEDLKRTRDAIRNTSKQTVTLQHLPTPMAQTVFGKELHLRLQAGRLTLVPLDEFAERLKVIAPAALERSRDKDEVTEMTGPVEGFRMRFKFVRVTRRGSVGGSQMMQTRFELDKFELIPMTEYLGEPLVQALQPSSRFRQILQNYNPQKTTVTVWTYPDSFGEFRQLKEELFRLGYSTASRPLPAGQLIGGSPRGTQSAAQ